MLLPRRLRLKTERKPWRATSRRMRPRFGLEVLESRRLLTTYYVTTTDDSGIGSFRDAIDQSNLDNPGPNQILFDLAAVTNDPDVDFNPATQDWTIALTEALPKITTPVDIDGFSQAHVGIPYTYPNQSQPTEITSTTNTVQATQGNNARVRVIVNGNGTGGATGFTLDASDSMIRGLIIDGFGVGVDVPNSDDVGDSIQGDFIGAYLLYPVDPNTGQPLPSPNGEQLVTPGNSQQGVIIDGENTTLGGASTQDDNVIAGNGDEGVWLQGGSVGSQVLGNQMGVVGPSDYGVYWSAANGAEGVLVQSSSDLIGVSGAGNIVSANDGDGVQLDQGATQVQVAGNFIGVAPGGGFVFGNEPPGNHGDGVDIIGGANNTIGGSSSGAGNAISANLADGVEISGSSATGNVVSNNMIGVTSDGSQALGNSDDGVVVTSSQTQIGPGNVISANQVGVLISGSTIAGITVIGNLIGTDATGELDLGNAFEGVLIQGAGGVTIQGNANGSQVISGNTVGVEITGPTPSGSLILGNFIGTDKTGSLPLPNAAARHPDRGRVR